MMNTIDNWIFTATIHDEERKKFWVDALGMDTVPILSPFVSKVKVPEHGETLAYMLDVMALGAEQITRLASMLADKFEIDPDDAQNLVFDGVPILAEGVTVTIKGVERFL